MKYISTIPSIHQFLFYNYFQLVIQIKDTVMDIRFLDNPYVNGVILREQNQP